jgi:hypothetical protein
MGRPLNKKYFGNRNTGSASVTTDNSIGGGAVASVTLNALGAYTTRPTIGFSAPTIPGGVTATGTITSEVESVTAVGGTQVGYTVGQLVTVDGSDAVLRVATIGGTGGDDALTFDFTGGSRGTFTTLPTGAQATTSNGAGVALTVTLAFRAKAVVITEAGSGYAAAPTPTFTQSVTATSVNMLVDSGVISTTGNQENAIVMTAFLTGGSATTVDIIRQVSTNRYKVTDGTRTTNGTTIPHVQLQSTLANAAGECSIAATDSAGGEYFVTKLTARKATVTRAGGSGWLYATNQAAPWKFDTAAGIYLQIANA